MSGPRPSPAFPGRFRSGRKELSNSIDVSADRAGCEIAESHVLDHAATERGQRARLLLRKRSGNHANDVSARAATVSWIGPLARRKNHRAPQTDEARMEAAQQDRGTDYSAADYALAALPRSGLVQRRIRQNKLCVTPPDVLPNTGKQRDAAMASPLRPPQPGFSVMIVHADGSGQEKWTAMRVSKKKTANSTSLPDDCFGERFALDHDRRKFEVGCGIRSGWDVAEHFVPASSEHAGSIRSPIDQSF